MVWKIHVLLIPYGNGPKLAQHFIIDSGDLSVLSNDARNLIGCRDLWEQRSELGHKKGTFVIYQIWTKMEYGNSKVRLGGICQTGIMKANPCYNEFCDY